MENREPPDEDHAFNELQRLRGTKLSVKGQTKRDEASSVTTAADGATSLNIQSRINGKVGGARDSNGPAAGTESKLTLYLASEKQDSVSNAS